MVQLFCSKLKWFYKDKVSTTPNLRDKIQKEKDLLEQLDEAKNGDPADADPKAKGKKGGGKTPEEIEADIKTLLQPDISGWILIDFPRDIKQAKLLENSFTGYELVSDKAKPDNVLNFETWTKFSDPLSLTAEGYNCQIEPQSSLFDIFFVLNTSREECLRRA